MGSIEIVGLVDIRKQSAVDRAQEFGLENALIGADIAEVLKETSSDIVFDCTVPEAHVHIALEVYL